jgi:cyclohexyl-isocyanide hydratase
VCSGSLILDAAGLLRGYRAATHWGSTGFLPAFGAVAAGDRICVDRNRITGGGVTAGIDFGLCLAAVIAGDEVAQRIQLYLEYGPEQPFHAGSPDSAPPSGYVPQVGSSTYRACSVSSFDGSNWTSKTRLLG